MYRHTSNLSSKQQVELLFDELYEINYERKTVRKSPESSSFDLVLHRDIRGDDVVSDSKTKSSGSFSRDIKKLTSRSPLMNSESENNERSSDQLISRGLNAEDESLSLPEGELAAAALNNEGPTEEVIRETANNIAMMGDELDGNYKKNLNETGEKLAESLNNAGSEINYDIFAALLTEVIPKDHDVNTFMFLLHLSSMLFWKLGFSFVSYFKRYISEQFSQEGASIIRMQQEKMGPQ